MNPTKEGLSLNNSHTDLIAKSTSWLLAECLTFRQVSYSKYDVAEDGTRQPAEGAFPFFRSDTVEIICTPDCLNKVKRHLTCKFIGVNKPIPMQLSAAWEMVKETPKVRMLN